jgi:hypothetical protein
VRAYVEEVAAPFLLALSLACSVVTGAIVLRACTEPAQLVPPAFVSPSEPLPA